MNKLTIFLIYIIAFAALNTFDNRASTIEKVTFTGRVTDKNTLEVLTGVNIYIPELKTGTVTNSGGEFILEDLPATPILCQVSYLGYKTIVTKIDLSKTTTRDFQLESSVQEINALVVTGTSKATEMKRSPAPITIVPKTELVQSSSSNIIDAISKIPGVSQITTGNSISKPVIRGLGYNRVIVVNDGIPQEGQQWGDEHGIEIDQYGVNRIEILKGPASLSYGSDALAGVINIISEPVLPRNMIKGNLLLESQTNDGLTGISGDIAGNLKGLVWNARFSGKQAHSYKNKYDGYVYGSAFRENNIQLLIGLNKSWGYSHLKINAYHLQPGIIEGARDSLTGKFTREAINSQDELSDAIVTNKDLLSYKPGVPYQQIHHYKAVSTSSFIVRNGNIKTIFGFQQNRRQEFGDALNPNKYGLYFLLNTFNYNIQYLFPDKNNWQVSTGISGMWQSSLNKGTEFLVPEYRFFETGGFVTIDKHINKIDISGGLRYDVRFLDSKNLFINNSGERVEAGTQGSNLRFSAFNNQFFSTSGSFGITYQFSEHYYTKLNLSRGYRAPNIAELGSNGVHEGTNRYELGNPAMKAEHSLEVDYSFGITTEHVSAEVNLFNNDIGNYIYLRKLINSSGGDSIMDISEPIPTFTYNQGNANLSGGEIRVDIHPHPYDWIHFENSFSFVRAVQKQVPDSLKYLPFIPAPKFRSELRTDIKKAGNFFRNTYFEVSLERYFARKKVFMAYDTETQTPAYTLINVGVGTDIAKRGKTICSVYLNATNIADIAYQSHLSRLKYTDINMATGRTGVFNMGRNIGIKIIVPLSFDNRNKTGL